MRRWVAAAFVVALFCCGCFPAERTDRRRQAAGYARQAQELWGKAAALYGELSRQAPADPRLAFELGMVYFNKGDFAAAAGPLRSALRLPGAAKYLGIVLYRRQEFTDALDVFKDIPAAEADDETRYFYALTCAELNLYDQALELYGQISRSSPWAEQAAGRLEEIEKQAHRRTVDQADPFAAALIANAPGPQNYPQAGGLILWCDEKETITSDNRSLMTVRFLVKIFNERGKESYAEMPVEYDSTYEKVELEYARTIRPDGVIVEVGQRHLRDVSKYMNFPLYSNARVFLISFPEVAAGSVVEYRVKITRNQLLNKKDFVLPYTLQSSDPVLRCRFELDLPADRKVSFKNFNEKYNDFKAELQPQENKNGDRVSYVWEFKDIPQIVPEPDMPAAVEINPGFIVSSFSGWQSIYDWWRQLSGDKIKPDDAITAQVNELTAGKTSQRQKAAAIHNFCAQKIRYVAVEYGDAGYEPHQAADIYKNKYGDCKDQAVLLVTMLRQAGLTSWPVLIGTREHYPLDPEFPAALFNHAIACVELDGGLVFLDPTAETCPFGDLPLDDQHRRVLVIKDDGFVIARTPGFDPEHNLSGQSLSITVNEDGSISAGKTVRSSGVYNQGQRYWLVYTVPETVRDTITRNLQDISIGSRLIEYRTSDLNDLSLPVTLEYRFSGREFFTSAGRLRILPQIGRLDPGIAAKESRRYPLDLGFAGIQQVRTEIKLPAKAGIVYLPVSLSEKSPWLDVDAVYTAAKGALIIEQRVATKQRQVPAEEYPAFKEFVERVSSRLKQRIVLKER